MRPVSGEARSTALRWGCASLALLVLLVAGIGYAGYRWLAYTGRQVPVESVSGPGSTGLLVVDPRPGDPGVEAMKLLMTRELVDLARDRKAELPPFSPEILARAGGEVVPAQAAVSFERLAGSDSAEPVIAVNFPGHARLMGMISTRVVAGSALGSHLSVERHGGYEMVGSSPVICMRDGTLLLTTTREAMVATLDRLDRGDAGTPPAKSRLEGEWDMRGVFRGDEGMLDWLLPRSDPDAAVLRSAVETMEFGADLVTDDEMRAVLLTRCRSAKVAGASRVRMEKVLAEWAASMRGGSMTMTSKTVQEGQDLRSTIRLVGVAGAVRNWFKGVRSGQPAF